ncbi:MAG: BREX-1 system adenine-specific DNA-methyltransferase PglX [Methanosarcinaceae archaeon]|nr:BREX-1 system adenine-specific DNA-methyltransferase PglX [Methanosarcinaceae archaeon]
MTNNKSSTTSVPNFYLASASDFKKIPGSPIAYWMSNKMRDIFVQETIIGHQKGIFPAVGLFTCNNDLFMRGWHEISFCSFELLAAKDQKFSTKKWVPYNKGGNYRKWYGNFEYVVNYYENGKLIREYRKKSGQSYSLPGEDNYFKEGITWTDLTSGKLSVRYLPKGFIYDVSGHSSTFSNLEDLLKILSYLNTKYTENTSKIINTTFHFQIGDFKKLPYPSLLDTSQFNNILTLISIGKTDWNSYETSWDFTTLPLLQPEYRQPTLRETYTKLSGHWKEMTMKMQRLEEENNRIFIDAYGLQDELTPDVPLSEITLTCNPHYRYNGDKSEEELEVLLLTDTIKEFISYAVGCMFGRYSLDKPGLVLANQGEKKEDYLKQVPEPSFMPDGDNIIPILEDEYFEDDILDRFKDFLKVTFGKEKLSENLDFIAEALGNKGNKSSETVIRDYFLKSFYKDHVKMYKKRPIYWLFSSGKGRTFNALIYMHRYRHDTLAVMRTDYLLDLEGKLDAKRDMIKSDIGKDAQTRAKLGKMIDELMAYDEVLKNKADAYIEIDLDDGVKVNYEKFEGLVEKI